MASALKALGIPVGPVVTMGTKEEGPKEALKAIREADQVKGQYVSYILSTDAPLTHLLYVVRLGT